VCREQEPELLEVEPNHFAACHFWDEIQRRAETEAVAGAPA
jgi:hypothetical protein